PRALGAAAGGLAATPPVTASDALAVGLGAVGGLQVVELGGHAVSSSDPAVEASDVSAAVSAVAVFLAVFLALFFAVFLVVFFAAVFFAAVFSAVADGSSVSAPS